LSSRTPSLSSSARTVWLTVDRAAREAVVLSDSYKRAQFDKFRTPHGVCPCLIALRSRTWVFFDADEQVIHIVWNYQNKQKCLEWPESLGRPHRIVRLPCIDYASGLASRHSYSQEIIR
jgi:hypothetical protein